MSNSKKQRSQQRTQQCRKSFTNKLIKSKTTSGLLLELVNFETPEQTRESLRIMLEFFFLNFPNPSLELKQSVYLTYRVLSDYLESAEALACVK